MNVGIIDDEPLARMELRYLLSQTVEVEEIYEGESIEEAFQLLLTKQPDLLFLDIHLTDESGLDLARKLVQVPNPPLIIFATAYDTHAVEAFEVNALDYVLKPFDPRRIQQAVTKAKRALEQKNQVVKEQVDKLVDKNFDRLTVETDERIYLVPFGDILYCEVQGKQTTIFTKETHYTTNIPLLAIEKALKDESFLKVHRSYVVNQAAIKEIQPWFNSTFQLTMTNGGKVPVSRSYLKVFKEKVGL